jgi:hypothetical protein
VTLVDNGLRCFVSPCFQWDVVDEGGEKLASVSFIDTPSGLAEGYDWQAIVLNGLKVSGQFEDYRGEGAAAGLAFIVEKITED